MSALVEALNDAGITKYYLTKHAYDRAKLRFGIDPEHAPEWVNEKMKEARLLDTNDDKCDVYEDEGIRFVIDPKKNAVVTMHSNATASSLRPIINRELRKLERNYGPQSRKLERVYAELLQELADIAMNRSRAKNPDTRRLITERMQNKQREIDEVVTNMERVYDEYKSRKKALEIIVD